MKSLDKLLIAIFSDLERLHPDVTDLERDLKTALFRLEHEGPSFLSKTLRSLGDAIFHGVTVGKFTCPSSFKSKGSLPVFLRGLIVNVFDSDGTVRSDASAESLNSLRFILYTFKKFLPEGVELNPTPFEEDFLNHDRDLKCSPDSRMRFILKRVSRIAFPVFPFDWEIPKHGPGAVYEGFTTNQKWEHVSTLLASGSFNDFLPGIDLSLDYTSVQMSKQPDIGYTARVVMVPKTSSSLRTITVEPCLLQFLQQILNQHLRRRISLSPLKYSLRLRDQSVNSALALSSSLTGDFSTIDLSKASDSVSHLVVKLVFGHDRDLITRLYQCRSRIMDVSGKLTPIRKYAGMGNATTFPVESIIFAVISIASMLDHDGKEPSYRNVMRYARLCSVFGDDIIIPKKYTWSLGMWLTSFGFQMNQNKSFSSGYFRESCGTDAYKGVDITPPYIRTLPHVSKSSRDASLSSCVAVSNLLWKKAYYTTATVMADLVERYISLPLVRPDSGCLGLHDRLGSYNVDGWYPPTFRYFVRGYVPRSKPKKDPLDGNGALLKCLTTPFDSRRVATHLLRNTKRYNASLRLSKVLV